MTVDISQMRRDYARATLTEAEAAGDPLRQFEVWLKQALEAQLNEPYAMSLATVDASFQPSARIVLLRAFDERGFVFFTNYESRKGENLRHNAKASLLFYWAELERQVRIEGGIERLDEAESDRYFESRPAASRVGAWASEQSRVIAGRDVLEARVAHFSAQFGDKAPRPPHWGGYRLAPHLFEFWQGRESRLHDRLQYSRRSKVWQLERLAP